MRNAATLWRSYDGRATLRSLADALEKLRELGSLHGGEELVEIRAAVLSLPDYRRTHVIGVLGPVHEIEPRWVVWMPSSETFTATGTMGARSTYDVALLDGAVSDADGNVELSSGLFLHCIDFRPTRMNYEFNAVERRIIRGAVAFLEAEEQCYLPVDAELLPGVKRLAYDQVRNLRVRRAKALRYFVRKAMPEITDNLIDATLARAGVRSQRRAG